MADFASRKTKQDVPSVTRDYSVKGTQYSEQVFWSAIWNLPGM